MPDATQSQSPLFPLLVAKFGFGTAMQLIGLLDPQRSDVSKGLGAAKLAGQATNVAGGLARAPGIANIGRYLGTAATAAGAGYGLYNVATDPNLNTTKKIGHANELAGDVAVSAVPYGALGLLAKQIVGTLEKSGSPQISGLGKGLASPARPVEALLGISSGDLSPRAAANQMIQQGRDTPGLGAVLSPIFDALGLGTKPTTGTDFRSGLQNIFGKVGLDKNFNRADKNLYNAPKTAPVSSDALALGAYLGSFAPGFNKNPDAYANQAANILTNVYGKNLPGVLSGIGTKLHLSPAEAMSRFQSLGLGKDFLNKLQQGSVLFGKSVVK